MKKTALLLLIPIVSVGQYLKRSIVAIPLMLLLAPAFSQTPEKAAEDFVPKQFQLLGRAINYTANHAKGTVKSLLIQSTKKEFEGIIYWDNINLFGKAIVFGIETDDNPQKVTLKGEFKCGGVGGWPEGTGGLFSATLYWTEDNSALQGKYTIHKNGKLFQQEGWLNFDQIYVENREKNAVYTSTSKILSSPIKNKELINPTNNPTLEWFKPSVDLVNRIKTDEWRNVVDSVNADGFQLAISPLSWYDNIDLLRLSHPSWKNNLALYYLIDVNNFFEGEGQILTRLNGDPDPIHDANANEYVEITEDNVTDYLKFFTFFTRTDEASFLIVENKNSPYLIGNRWLYNATKQQINPVLVEYEEKGSFTLKANLFYKNILYQASFVVQPTGIVTMSHDKPLLDSLNQSIHIPIK